jgi:hypothetical protein
VLADRVLDQGLTVREPLANLRAFAEGCSLLAAMTCAAMPNVVLAQRPAAGQTRGIVVDSSGRPLESVEISATTVGRFARTDSAGRFSMGGLLTGRNRLLIRRLGWRAIDTTIVVDPKSPTELHLVLASVAQDLQAVHVVSQDECPTRTLEGFECRRRAGLGAFRDSAEIAALKPTCQAHIVDGMAGLRLVAAFRCPNYEATTGWRCLTILVDGLPPRVGRAPALMRDYVGVEFYADYKNAPEWYKQYAFADATQGVPTHQATRGGDILYRGASLPGRECSLLVYWSHFAPKFDPSLDQSSMTTQVMKARRDSVIGMRPDSIHAKADSTTRRKP